MMVNGLIITGSLIFLWLGSIHMIFTFRGTKFFPRNLDVKDAMEKTYPTLTKETTMWKAWVGFNASHSMGAIFFGMMNLVLIQSSLYRETLFIGIVNIIFVLIFLFLAIKYWFRIPLIGISIATVCFVIAFVIQLLHVQMD
jgi:hypothetical protein